jgi:hypothetical protein
VNESVLEREGAWGGVVSICGGGWVGNATGELEEIEGAFLQVSQGFDVFQGWGDGVGWAQTEEGRESKHEGDDIMRCRLTLYILPVPVHTGVVRPA